MFVCEVKVKRTWARMPSKLPGDFFTRVVRSLWADYCRSCWLEAPVVAMQRDAMFEMGYRAAVARENAILAMIFGMPPSLIDPATPSPTPGGTPPTPSSWLGGS